MSAPLLAAIDVGKSGGIAWHFEDAVVCEKMPASESGVLELLLDMKSLHQHGTTDTRKPPVVYIEKVSGFIGHAHPGSRMFSFGEGYGFLKGVLMATGWKIILVTPQVWMKSLGLCNSQKLPPNKWKNKLKDEACRLYPDQKPTLATRCPPHFRICKARRKSAKRASIGKVYCSKILEPKSEGRDSTKGSWIKFLPSKKVEGKNSVGKSLWENNPDGKIP